jgi:ferric-dicitrate binding protein FerR (iron transport regulator)
VVSVQGSVEVQRAGETQWQTVKLNDSFCPGDKIRVDERSRAALTLVNQPVLRLDQNTSITLGGVKEKRTSVVELARGALHFFSRVRRNLEVLTGFVNAGVEGTEGFIRVEKDRTFISIFDGQVLASNAVGSLTLTGGQSAVAEAGKARQAKRLCCGLWCAPGMPSIGHCTICRSCSFRPQKRQKKIRVTRAF